MTEATDPRTAEDPAAAWTALVTRYYDGCSAGDLDELRATLHPDVVHYFLAPNPGSAAGGRRRAPGPVLAQGGEDDRRPLGGRPSRWRRGRGGHRVDDVLAARWRRRAGRDPRRGVVHLPGRPDRRDPLLLPAAPETTELDGFPYAARGYSASGPSAATSTPPPTGSAPTHFPGGTR